MTPPALEHDYIGLSEVSSNGSSGSSATGAAASDSYKFSNLKQTELRLGLPGSESPDRGSGLTLSINLKSFGSGSGSKRGLDALSGSPNKWGFNGGSGSDNELFSPKKGGGGGGGGADVCGAKDTEKKAQINSSSPSAPAAKAQVVGWPPIRNYRKNTMANANNNLSKKKEEGDGKQGAGCLYVKVSMDGAPYLRKVDLKTYSNYKELALALEKMFSCFTIGQCGSHGMPRDGLTESRMTELIDGSENVLTYEDKDGDWMLVGDVPWEMFTETCRRLRIMKGSDAIGLAPRATEKSKNRN